MTTLDSSDSLRRAPAFAPAAGEVVGGRFRLVRPLGEGGMGAVFEAENVLTFKRAAVKWVHPRLSNNGSARDRLLHEARATSRIRHRNVVDVYDVVLDGGAVMLVMELLHGKLLSEYLEQTTIPMFEFVGLLLPAMEGVASAHAAGVVHRDIKPENIFLVRESGVWVPKVIDFGIAKTSGGELTRLTHSGMVLGTPRYISFEQLRGDADVDGRTDIYSFGVMLYEALLGRAPYDAKTLGEQAVQFLTTVPPGPKLLRPEVPAALDALVRKAIAPDREQRFANMSELIETLRPFANERAYPVATFALRGDSPLPAGACLLDAATRPYAATTPTPQRPSISRVSRPRARAIWVLVAVMAAAAVFAVARASRREPPRKEAVEVAASSLTEPTRAEPASVAPLVTHQTRVEPVEIGATELRAAKPLTKPAKATTRTQSRARDKPLVSPAPVAADPATREDSSPSKGEVSEETLLRAGHVRATEF